jgi:diguanylate cyclase (GGDEF)-like protein
LIVSYLPPNVSELAVSDKLRRRLERERTARREAERLLESKSLELFELNKQLLAFNAELEARVHGRTAELEAARAAAFAMLHTDYLTGVGSRVRYREALAQAISSRDPVGLVLIDLDGFKQVNDTFGHQVGDALLCDVAERLKALLAGDDLVVRIGGDEFALLIKRSNRESIEAGARTYKEAFGGWVTLTGHTVPRRASMGMAIAPDDVDNSADLQRFADLALYHAKYRGGGDFAVFEPDMLIAYEERQRLEVAFRQAVRNDDIEAWYQPIVEIGTGQVRAVEALARWRDDKGRYIGPDIFIPLAERSGLIQELSEKLLAKALVQARPWVERSLIKRMSFNVSPLDLLKAGFADRILSALDISGFPAANLMLEVTESAVLDDVEAAITTMRSLTSEGIQFALDDFGSGYSNLSYLQRLPISILKLDKSLLSGSSEGAADVIIRHMVALCRQLGMQCVCEGVETSDQAEFLKSVACEYGQGFLYHRPASAPATERLLITENARQEQSY